MSVMQEENRKFDVQDSAYAQVLQEN